MSKTTLPEILTWFLYRFGNWSWKH